MDRTYITRKCAIVKIGNSRIKYYRSDQETEQQDENQPPNESIDQESENSLNNVDHMEIEPNAHDSLTMEMNNISIQENQGKYFEIIQFVCKKIFQMIVKCVIYVTLSIVVHIVV